MKNKQIGNLFAVLAILCFVIAIIGMAAGGSHRWVEPVEELGWIFFVGCVLAFFLLPERGAASGPSLDPSWVRIAWGAGAVAIALLLAALVGNLASTHYKYWLEALETAGLLGMFVTVLAAVMARGFGPRV